MRADASRVRVDHPRVEDVIVTVAVAIVLGPAFMYLLVTVAFSGWVIISHDRRHQPARRWGGPTIDPSGDIPAL